MFANDYTLGKGKFYFRRFLPGTQTPEPGGFRRLGNIPEANVSQNIEKLDHTSSEGGINVKDASVDTANDQSLAFTTDNVSMANLALWFNSAVTEINEAGGAVVGEELGDFQPDSYAQLGGNTLVTPQGVRNVTLVTIKGKVGNAASAALVAGQHYRVDARRGLVEFLVAVEDVTADYTTTAGVRRVILGGSQTIEGELKFFAENPKGSNKDTYWPYVQVSPDGDYALIGTDWQTVGFAVSILQPADGRPRSITEVS